MKLYENFRGGERFVADGHLVKTPASINYSTVVSKESIKILLLVAYLNNLETMGADVNNAFLSDENLENIGLGLALNLELNKGNYLLL